MAKVIDLNSFKRKQIGEVCFKLWSRRFNEHFDEATSLKDLSDRTILFLASPGSKSANAFYELIKCVLSPQSKAKFQPITKEEELEYLDIYLLLADRTRFELMKRLSWISEYCNEDDAIIDLIPIFKEDFYQNFHKPPKLSENHPDFQTYETLIEREKEVHVKKMFVNALIQFNARVNNSSDPS